MGIRRAIVPGLALAIAGIAGVSCSDPPTRPPQPLCTRNTTLTVGPGTEPVFSWSPECRTYGLGISRAGSSQGVWLIESQAEDIVPPVQFGRVPQGAAQTGSAAPLTRGQGYFVFLVERGSGAVLAVKEFTP